MHFLISHIIPMSYVCNMFVLYIVIRLYTSMRYARTTHVAWESVAHDVNRHRYLSL